MKSLLRIGVDVGGTNTDAVLIRGREVCASHKAPTSSDIGSGIMAAISAVLRSAAVIPAQIDVVMIGTTHFTNALIEAQNLSRIGLLRLGSPATHAIRPLVDWPSRLREAVFGHAEIVPGGFNYDGRPISQLSKSAIKQAANAFRAHHIESVAISSVFSPVNPKQEEEAADYLQSELPGLRITLSGQTGRIGLIERENATAINAALLPMAERVVRSFNRALADLGIRAPYYVSQNDGTLLDPDTVSRYPVLTFASGPTNSMRGASFLSGAEDALVVDIGGTTTDVGALLHGFPRESAVAVDIGGVRTNFRMPDLLSVGLGGGSLVSAENGRVKIGPESVGHRLTQEALVFGGSTLTATDIAVAAGVADIGDRRRVANIDRSMVQATVEEIHRLAEDAIDRMKTSAKPVPVILVGGGAILISRDLRGAASITTPEHADVANAVGAAIAQVSGVVDRVFSYETSGREAALTQAREEAVRGAVAAGASPDSVKISDLEELPLQYLPGGAVRVRVKAVGDLMVGKGH